MKCRMQFRLLRLLLQPSIVSAVFVVVATTAILAGANWSYITSSPELYDLFYGSQGIVTVFEGAPQFVNNANYGVVNSQVAYALEVVITAVVAAGVVFVALHGIRHFLWTLRAVNASGVHEERRELLRTALERCIILVLWAIYTLFSVAIAVPFCILLSRIGIEDNSIAADLGAFGLLALLLHGHVVFARLFRLRPRLFGGEAAIRSALEP